MGPEGSGFALVAFRELRGRDHLLQPKLAYHTVEARCIALWEIVDAGKLMTVRQVFYQTTVHDLVPRTEKDYEIQIIHSLLPSHQDVQKMFA